jgi:large subunit ribosomal protein L25
LVNVEIKGNTVHLSDIAAIQRDLVTDKFLHADFHEVSQSEKMTIAVLLEFFGEAIGVKQNGGVLYIVRHEVTITSLPADLPSSIRVDVSDLGVGAVMDFSDLVVPGGIEWVGNYASPIVSCNSIAAEEKAKEVVSAEITAAEVVAPKTEQSKIMANSRIIGLGNPGTEYDLIRHNVRFRIVDAFANEKDCAGL